MEENIIQQKRKVRRYFLLPVSSAAFAQTDKYMSMI